MVAIHQGDIWWAELAEPQGSALGFRRPVIVVQSDAVNHSRLATVVCVPLTSNLQWATAPGNLLLLSKSTGLPKDCVANVSQIVILDKSALTQPIRRLPARSFQLILAGIDILLGR